MEKETGRTIGSSHVLRDYQVNSLDLIREEFRNGHRKALLWLATGAGKTTIFCKMLQGIQERKRHAIVVVRGRKLVDQASHRLMREGTPHGVLMAGHWNYRPHFPIQVCSIDTLIARGLIPKANLIVIDEAHLFSPKSKAGQFIAQYPHSQIVSVTATPWIPGGLSHIADTVVHPITMQELIDQRHLLPFRYYAPQEPDLSGVHISSSTHDYVNLELETKMISGQLTGKIIDHWKEIASDRKTICFAVNIHHSKLLVEKFLDAGIRAEHCDADTPDQERENIIRRLESGVTEIVCNVGIFCTGVDIPPLSCIILARPTKSYNLFIQQCGRGTRPFAGKSDCILLDHAGNIKRHGFPTMELPVTLNGKLVAERGELGIKICKNCFACYRGKICPQCGIEPEVRTIEVIESEEKLEEIKISAKSPIEQWLEYLQQQRQARGFKPGWVYHKLLDKFTEEECKPYLPDWFVNHQQKKDDPFARSPYRGVSKS